MTADGACDGRRPVEPPSSVGCAPSSLGPDWTRGDDGLYFRRAARILLLDGADRLLLIRGHDADQPERSWWFTVGGGIDPGESDLDAAVREVREETGIVLDPARVAGPVFTRSAVFDFVRERCRQDEVLYLARLAGPGPDASALSRDGWTDLELDVVDELRWWTLDELRAVEIEVFPVGLADLVAPLMRGWDGVTRHLGEAFEL